MLVCVCVCVYSILHLEENNRQQMDHRLNYTMVIAANTFCLLSVREHDFCCWFLIAVNEMRVFEWPYQKAFIRFIYSDQQSIRLLFEFFFFYIDALNVELIDAMRKVCVRVLYVKRWMG